MESANLHVYHTFLFVPQLVEKTMDSLSDW